MKLAEIAAVMIAITLIGGLAIFMFAPKADYATGANVRAYGDADDLARARGGGGCGGGCPMMGGNNVRQAEQTAKNAAKDANTAPTPATAGEKVVVPIKVVNGYYQPREIRVRQGSTVRLEFDQGTFTGCMRIFNIWNYGVRVDTAQNAAYEFVADKKGTFRTSCNMGMGDGTFIVE